MLVAPRISECFGLLQSTLDLVCYCLPCTWSAIDASHLTSSFAPFGRSGRQVCYRCKALACSISMVTKLPTQAVCIFVALYISIFVPLFLYQCTLYRCNFVFLPMYFVSWFLCIFVCFFLLLKLYFYCFFLLLYLSGIFFISFFLKSTVFLQPFCSTVLNYENQSGQRLILSETQCLE